MKERPILFSGPMVRALLNCTKSQTRRVIKNTGFYAIDDHHGEETAKRERAALATQSPYGQPGDRLWVRETWQGPLMDADIMETEYRADPDRFHKPEYCVYAADGGDAPEFITLDDELVKRWRPSIHMPRWASRILLEITSVRVEQLQDISEADARAEGVADGGCLSCGEHEPCGCADPKPDARDSFCRLWQSINGAESWHANPWVWVVEFKRVMP